VTRVSLEDSFPAQNSGRGDRRRDQSADVGHRTPDCLSYLSEDLGFAQDKRIETRGQPRNVQQGIGAGKGAMRRRCQAFTQGHELVTLAGDDRYALAPAEAGANLSFQRQ
jgi:hypothetical protein